MTEELRATVESERIERMVDHAVRLSRAPRGYREEARQEAWVGLLECLPRYDGRTELATFAQYRCIGRIKDFFRRQDPLTRQQRKAVKAEEMTEPIILIPAEVLRATLASPRDPSPTARVDVDRLIKTLPLRLRRVIQMLYLEDRTLAEVALTLGIGYSRVPQLRDEALRWMRRSASRKAA